MQFWMPVALLSVGLVLLLARSHVAIPALRVAMRSLAYGSFTLALFEGAGTLRSLLAGQRRRD